MIKPKARCASNLEHSEFFYPKHFCNICGSSLLYFCPSCEKWENFKNYKIYHFESKCTQTEEITPKRIKQSQPKDLYKMDNLNKNEFQLKQKKNKEIISSQMKMIAVEPNILILASIHRIKIKIAYKEVPFNPLQFVIWKICVSQKGYEMQEIEVTEEVEITKDTLNLTYSNFPGLLNEEKVSVFVKCYSEDLTHVINDPFEILFKNDTQKEEKNEVVNMINTLYHDQAINLKETHPYEMNEILNKIKNSNTLLGYNILHYYACQNETETLKMILDSKLFDINSQDKFGFTPLFWSKLFKTENEKILKEYGAKENITSIFGNNQIEDCEMITKPKIVPISPQKKRRPKKPTAYVNSLNTEIIEFIPNWKEKEERLFLMEIIMEYKSRIFLFPKKHLNTKLWRILLKHPQTGVILHDLEVDAIMEFDETKLRLVCYHFPIVKAFLSVKFIERSYTAYIGPSFYFNKHDNKI